MRNRTAPTPKLTGAEDVAVSIARRAIILISGVAMQSILAYGLSPSQRGAYAVCLVSSGLLGLLFTPGTNAGTQYFVMTNKITVSQGVSASLAICIIGAGLATALTLPLIHSGIAYFQQAPSASFYLALVLVPLSTFAGAVHHQLAGLARFAPLARSTLIQTTVNVLATVAFVFPLRLGVNGALLAICAGDLAMIILCLRDMKRHAGLRWVIPQRSVMADVLRYGLRYHLARIGNNVDVRIGVVLLGILAPSAKVGFFAVASALMMRVLLISDAVAAPLLPRAARDALGRPALVAFCSRVTIWVTAAALTILLSCSTSLVRAFLSADYLPVVPLIRTISPGVIAFASGNIIAAYFRVMNRPNVCSWAAGIGLTANLTLVPLLYPLLGLSAAAVGLSAGLLLRTTVLLGAYCRATRTPLSQLWLLQRGDFFRVVEATRMMIVRVTSRISVRPSSR